MGVDIGPRVLSLAVFSEHVRSHLKQVADQAEHGVVGEVLLGKHSLTRVARIRLPQNCMAVSRDNLIHTHQKMVISKIQNSTSASQN